METLVVSKLENTVKYDLVEEVFFARTFLQRLVGLLGKKALNENQGLMLNSCSSVHTIGMRFPIDVVFIDKERRILKIFEDVKPFRQATARKAKYALEVGAGMAQRIGIKVGDELCWDN